LVCRINTGDTLIILCVWRKISVALANGYGY